MPSIITSKFRKHNAQQFIEAFSESESDNIYLYIGKTTPWSDDVNPPTPADSTLITDISEWNTMIATKRIGQTDVSHVTRRINWSSGTVFDEYDETNTDLFNSDFYVMNSNFYVYKCISNNGGVASTVEPVGNSLTIFETSDGYQWKFMYEISGAKALKFITPTYIPVQTLDSDDGSTQWDVQQGAVDGSIDYIKVTNGGSLYNQSASGDVVSGTNNTITFSVSSATNADSTNAFYEGATLYIDAGLGIGQLKTISSYVVAGDVATVTVDSDFSVVPDNTSSFKISPTVLITSTFSVDSPIVSYADVVGGSINKIQILDSGQGWKSATATIFVSANAIGAGATGSGAVLKPVISPQGGHGSDAVEELGGYSIMMNSRLEAEESGDFTIFNDFRKIGLLKNPLTANSTIATASTYDVSEKLIYTNTTVPFAEDATITGQTSGATAVIVDVDSSNVTLRITEKTGDFTPGEVITDGTNSDTLVSITESELKKYSGDVIYVDNRQPIIRGFDQVEDIKLVIDF